MPLPPISGDSPFYGALQRLAARFSAELRAGEPEAARLLARIWRSAYERAGREVERALEQAPDQHLFWAQRVQALRVQIAQEFSNAAALSADAALQRQALAATLAERHAATLLATAAPTSASFLRLAPDVVERWTALTASSSSPVRQALQRFAGREVEEAIELIAQGLAYGWNPTTTAELLSARFGVAATHALTVARTEQMRAYRDVTLEAYRRNDSLVEGWIWHAALDDRTCFVCTALHGTLHPLDEPMNGHPNCRCTMLPKVRSVPFSSPPVEELLLTMPDARARRLLGVAGYRAWRQGILSPSDLLGVRYNSGYGASYVKRPLSELFTREQIRSLLQEEE